MAERIEGGQPRLVILLGPTGAGKSGLAIELAEAFGGEILNADSMQVYRYMDIGTAKPTPEERQRIKHHLVDLVTPDQPFHAGLYRTLGKKTIDSLHRKETPIFVTGGTGLYIKALTQGLFAGPKINPAVREKLKHEAGEKGGYLLYRRLREGDPEAAARIHSNDLFRIIRALEVFESTGMPISFFRNQHRFGDRPYLTLKIGIEIDRERLYRRIEERVDRMIERGLLQEVKGLLEMGYGPALKPMQSLGYKQMLQFLSNQLEWDEAVRQMKRDTRHYAKRQWTWFKADREVIWRDASTDRAKIFEEVKSFLREP
ncbi:MAG: tRNA (adenosine(37)-N6)-dimethylallyltransferase MiaA [Deltaproteobacteria bacterium RBG_16_49_23]|nr:MAG: tRNA (adenosine(37)-N6)-dimethylallyltransferase MiaA [Deltaproteobacteria bacterium RBG_16_49_23]